MTDANQFVARLREAVARYEDLGRQMADPAVFGDRERLTKLAREHSEREPVARAAEVYLKLMDELEQAGEVASASGDDPEMAERVFEAGGLH